jgi:hypothetical protein
VATGANGGFVVAWQNELASFNYDVRGRRFDSSGTPQALEFLLSSPATGYRILPSVAADASGDFVAVWVAEEGPLTGFLRRFEPSTLPMSFDTQFNTTAGLVNFPSVASEPDGDFVVVWNGPDGSGVGIVGRRFDVASAIDIDGDGQYLPLTDGLLLLRFGFGFSGNALIAGAVGPGCTRCDAPSITTFLQDLL